MDREIKFKGKRIDNKEWIYGSLICEGERRFIVGYFAISDYLPKEDLMLCKCVAHEVEPETVEQFVELRDKNKNEIYGGNILHVIEVSDGRVTEYTSSVEWLESGFLVTEPNKTQVPLACFHVEPENQTYILFEIEVVGDIHDNPELLKEAVS